VAVDYDNVRAAMAYALERDLTVALRLLGSLTFFVWVRGGYAETTVWLDATLPRLDGQPPRLVGRVHEFAASVAHLLGDVEVAARHAEQAYAAFASVDDEQGMVDALRERGKAASSADDYEAARLLYTELAERAEQIGDRWNAAIALNNLGDVALQLGDWEQVIELCGRSSVLRRELGDEWGTALALGNVALAELELSRLSEAAETIHAGLELSMKVDARLLIVVCLGNGAALCARRGSMREAARLVGASSRLEKELGSEWAELDGLWEQTLESVRASLGAETEAEIQRGWELSLDEAVTLVFAETREPGSPREPGS
jgi:tetratricopeptide (TPR) repeat protein